MKKTLMAAAAVITLAVSAVAVPAPAQAQRGVAAGVAAGLIGGAIVGGVIGAAAATALTFDARPNGYYWYDSRCWYRYPNGEYRLVQRRYCGPY